MNKKQKDNSKSKFNDMKNKIMGNAEDRYHWRGST